VKLDSARHAERQRARYPVAAANAPTIGGSSFEKQQVAMQSVEAMPDGRCDFVYSYTPTAP